MDKLKLKAKIKCPKGWENCKICSYKEGFFECITGITFIEFLIDIHWREVVSVILIFLVFSLLWGWWGMFIGTFFCIISNFSFNSWGAWFLPDEYLEPPPEVKNECSAKIEGCRICNNEYNHEFNFKYEKGLKWYQKIW
ncbi:MAG: hypothetical protein AAB933_02905 [Patescibacteria group bacterium]